MKKEILFTAFIILLAFLPKQIFAHGGDTLKCNFTAGTPQLYPAINGGFICGTNGFGDQEVAQKYGMDTLITNCTAKENSTLSKVLVWFGGKSVDLTDSVRVKVYSVNTTTGGPDVLLSTSFALAMTAIDTSSSNDTIFTKFLLQTPVIITDSFFVSVVFSSYPGDTIGIMSTTDGDVQNTNLSWTKNTGGNWSSLSLARGLDVDLAIFPIVVDPHGTAIPEGNFSQIKIRIYPNPGLDNTTIEFQLMEPAKILQYTLFDISGKIIQTNKKYNLPPGTYKLTLDVDGLSSGTYLFDLSANGRSNTKKLLIN